MTDVALAMEEILPESQKIPIVQSCHSQTITPKSPNTEHFSSGASAAGVIITIIVIIIIIILVIWAIAYFNNGGYIYASPAYGYYGGGGYYNGGGSRRGYGRGDYDRGYREGYSRSRSR